MGRDRKILTVPSEKKKIKKKLLLTAYKTKCMVNGAIATAERKKREAWVELGKDRRSPDPTRPDPTRPDPSLLRFALHCCYDFYHVTPFY